MKYVTIYSTNALSRHVHVYICDKCRTDEAIRALCGDDLPLREWAVAKLHPVNTYRKGAAFKMGTAPFLYLVSVGEFERADKFCAQGLGNLVQLCRYKSKREVKAQAASTEKMLEVARRVARERLGVKRVNSADVKIAKNSDGKYVVRYRSKAYQLH